MFVWHLLWDHHCAWWNVIYNIIRNYLHSVNICWINILYSFFYPYGKFVCFLNIENNYIFAFAFCQVEHLHNFILFRFSMGFIDSIIAKCTYAIKEIMEWNLWKKWSILNLNCFVSDLATVVGYLVVSRPFLDLSHPRHLKSTHSELLEVK